MLSVRITPFNQYLKLLGYNVVSRIILAFGHSKAACVEKCPSVDNPVFLIRHDLVSIDFFILLWCIGQQIFSSQSISISSCLCHKTDRETIPDFTRRLLPYTCLYSFFDTKSITFCHSRKTVWYKKKYRQWNKLLDLCETLLFFTLLYYFTYQFTYVFKNIKEKKHQMGRAVCSETGKDVLKP
jgi:hypothetical protein